jgi:PAS domain S-box-containing protein
VAAVGVATLVRVSLTPYLGHEAPYATYFLAVVVATWIGGMAPGALTAFASLVVVWELFRGAPPAPVASETAQWLGAALFLTVALAIAGITSALRVARSGGLALREELAWRDAERDELEATLRDVADASPEMVWTCAADGRLSYANAAWRAYTGQTLDAALGDGWQSGIHADDVDEWRRRMRRALTERKPLSIEYRRKRHDGVYRRVVDEARPRALGEGGFGGLLGRTFDAVQRSRDATQAVATARSGVS